jgi:hypothetical protein
LDGFSGFCVGVFGGTGGVSPSSNGGVSAFIAAFIPASNASVSRGSSVTVAGFTEWRLPGAEQHLPEFAHVFPITNVCVKFGLWKSRSGRALFPDTPEGQIVSGNFLVSSAVVWKAMNRENHYLSEHLSYRKYE